MYDFLSIGEMLIDFTPQIVDNGKVTYVPNPGGAPANVACALAKLGTKAAFCGKVGDDAFGQLCISALSECGADTTFVALSEQPTSLACVHIDRDGDRSFTFYRNATADTQLNETDVAALPFAETGIFHFGTVSLSAEPSKSATLAAVARANKQKVIVSCDLNLRENLWGSKAEMMECINRDVLVPGLISILKVSTEELYAVTGEGDIAKAANALSEKCSIPVILVTEGKEGCSALINGKMYKKAAFAVDAVDTTGAGDCFLAGFLYCLLREKIGDLSLLTDEFAHGALRFANAMAAISTTRPGGIPSVPFLDEIYAMLKEKV